MDIVIDTSAINEKSPLGIPSISANVSTREIVDIVRAGRERE